MSQQVGKIKNGELWVRCPECGDSQRNRNKGHLSINLGKGLFYCVRCGYGGQLTVKQSFQLATLYDEFDAKVTDYSPVWTAAGPGIDRFSALERWNHVDEAGHLWDLFLMRDPLYNEPIGQYMRWGKKSIISGEHGFGWVGQGDLLSTPSRPIRIVEGPYDVLTEQDVCAFGFSSFGAVKKLVGHSVIICPDGDIWQDTALTEQMIKLVKKLVVPPGPTLVGVEVIPDGLDPDTCPLDKRKFVSRETLLQRIASTSRKETHRYAKGDRI